MAKKKQPKKTQTILTFKKLRIAAGYKNQAAVHRAFKEKNVQVAGPTISQWENGATCPTEENLTKIKQLLGDTKDKDAALDKWHKALRRFYNGKGRGGNYSKKKQKRVVNVKQLMEEKKLLKNPVPGIITEADVLVLASMVKRRGQMPIETFCSLANHAFGK